MSSYEPKDKTDDGRRFLSLLVGALSIEIELGMNVPGQLLGFGGPIVSDDFRNQTIPCQEFLVYQISICCCSSFRVYVLRA